METSPSLTNLEITALKCITQSDFYENGRESIVWDYSVYDYCPLKGKTRSGVFSSLSQKGFVAITEKEKPYTINKEGIRVRNPYYSRECNFGTLMITESGYAALDALNLLNEYGSFIN
jgi:hypothetical protein